MPHRIVLPEKYSNHHILHEMSPFWAIASQARNSR
jgi:hypothetical protein